MAQFRKKPIIVEAFQMTAERRTDSADWPDWLEASWKIPFEEVGSFYPLSIALCIHTLEGSLIVSDNDWIIKGIQGELYPCKPDIFAATYEALTPYEKE